MGVVVVVVVVVGRARKAEGVTRKQIERIVVAVWGGCVVCVQTCIHREQVVVAS